MSSISSDLYADILKPSKSHTNRIKQIILCKTAFSMYLYSLYGQEFMFQLPLYTNTFETYHMVDPATVQCLLSI